LTPGAQEIALEDFDYLINMILEVAPTQNIIQRRSGLSAEEFFGLFRSFIEINIPLPSITFLQMEGDDRWVEAQTEDLYIAADYLMSLLTLMSGDLQALGHMGPQPQFIVQELFMALSYMVYNSPSLEDLEAATIADAEVRFALSKYDTFTTAARWFYGLNELEVYMDEEPEIGTFDEYNIITYSIEPGEIAYLRINSFINNIDFDATFLFPFYEQIQNYEHLIIDLRGNGGGFVASFPFNVLAMLIDEPVSFQYVEFFIASELTAELFVNPASMALGVLYEMLPIAEFLQSNPMPAFNQDDFDLLDYAIIWQVDIAPVENSIPFGGEIWLLVDGESASASEMAALISMNTGFATVVGEPTAGVTGVVYTFAALPNTGIHFRIDLGYTVDSVGNSIEEFGITPQILTMPTLDAVQTVLALINPTVLNLDTYITLNGETVAVGVIINERTMVSATDIAYMFDLELIEEDWQALMFAGDDIHLFTLNLNTAFANWQLIRMHAPAQLINGELFLPIRSVAETFGYDVDFIDYVVVITSSEADDQNTEVAEIGIEALVGSWECIDTIFAHVWLCELTFNENGTFIDGDGDTGTFSVNGNQLTLTFDNPIFGSYTVSFIIYDDYLIITSFNVATVLRRV